MTSSVGYPAISGYDAAYASISARFTTAAGTGAPRSPEQIGVIPNFGSVGPAVGGALLALSSGIARSPSQPGYTSECDYLGLEPNFFGVYPRSTESYPPGFPVDSATCPRVRGGPVYNSVALEVRIRVPSNAFGFRFNSNFYTYEYPNFICDEYNDFYAVLKQDDGGAFENIIFDSVGEPVSVNNGLLQVCTPGTHGGKRFDCTLGRDQLSGTGFDGSALCGNQDPFTGEYLGEDVGAATGWLRTTAAVDGGQIMTLRFTIWDSGDPTLDSLTLIDGFEWELEDIVEDRPMTEPLI